jgi:NTE family protein
VVLSGGGAKGIAHVGILKALEQEGLKPDFIAGTSMGSVVGGLYAIGYTADQLDTIVREINWSQILSNEIPLEYVAYEEKEYYNRYLVELPIKKGKLQLPSGMLQGQMLDEMLSRLTWPSNNYESFDEFPIPFRCLATDVSTGKAIVFKDGSLAKAMRASMAIPTAFTPVDLDTTLVVDGGIVDNFPVGELIRMGADIIIGVNVSHGFESAYDINSMTGILMQISMIPSSEKLENQIKQCDIYIAPDLQGYSTASFGNYKEILQLGYEAGEKFKPEFKALAEKIGTNIDDAYKPPSLNPDSIYIGKILVTGNQHVNSTLILTKLQIEAGDKVSRNEIETGVNAIYGINNFDKVTYRLQSLPEENTYQLTIKVIEKTPAILKGSVHYDNIFGIGIVANVTLRNILGKSSRTIITGDISENPKFRFDYLKYIGKHQGVAINFKYDYLREKLPKYTNGKLIDLESSSLHKVHFNFITTQSLHNSISLGVFYEHNTQMQKFNSIVPEGVKHGIFSYFSGNLLFMANTFNDRNYPTKGREVTVGVQFIMHSKYKIIYEKGIDSINFSFDNDGQIIVVPINESDFNKYIIDPITPNPYGMAQFSIIRYFQIRKNFQVIPYFATGLTLSTDVNSLFQSYRIGGYQRVNYIDRRFFGLNYSEISWENYAMTGLFFQNIIIKSLYLKYGANFLLPYDHVPLNDLQSFSINTLLDKNSMLGYGAELTYKSFLGPISLGISRNTRDSYFRYYVAVGYSFNYAD